MNKRQYIKFVRTIIESPRNDEGKISMLRQGFLQYIEDHNRWIPCYERLPVINDDWYSDCVLVTDEYGWQGMAYHTRNGWMFAECKNSTIQIDWTAIVAWRPLPEKYERGN